MNTEVIQTIGFYSLVKRTDSNNRTQFDISDSRYPDEFLEIEAFNQMVYLFDIEKFVN
jgi:hypothetical protein